MALSVTRDLLKTPLIYKLDNYCTLHCYYDINTICKLYIKHNLRDYDLIRLVRSFENFGLLAAAQIRYSLSSESDSVSLLRISTIRLPQGTRSAPLLTCINVNNNINNNVNNNVNN